MAQESTSIEPVLLSPQEAAAALRLGRNSLAALIKSGELKSVRIGRAVRIPADDLRAFVARRVEDGSK